MNVKFHGIVRNASNQMNPDTSCEEIINMRVDASGALKAIGKKKTILADTAYTTIIEHSMFDNSILIAVRSNLVVSVDIETGVEQIIHTAPLTE